MRKLVVIAMLLTLSMTGLLTDVAVAGGLANVRLSDSPDGLAMTQFLSGTAVVYAIFDYADMQGEPITVRVYDAFGSILFEQIQSYTGSGTESVATATSEGCFPGGRYATNFYRGEFVSKTIIWSVEPYRVHLPVILKNHSRAVLLPAPGTWHSGDLTPAAGGSLTPLPGSYDL